MNWEATGAIGETIGAAVVVSVIAVIMLIVDP